MAFPEGTLTPLTVDWQEVVAGPVTQLIVSVRTDAPCEIAIRGAMPAASFAGHICKAGSSALLDRSNGTLATGEKLYMRCADPRGNKVNWTGISS